MFPFIGVGDGGIVVAPCTLRRGLLEVGEETGRVCCGKNSLLKRGFWTLVSFRPWFLCVVGP